jgi:hypothetical protein
MFKRRNVRKETVTNKSGDTIGTRKVVTKLDSMGEAKKTKIKFKGDKEYLQKRREQSTKADLMKKRKLQLDSDPGITEDTKRKIANAPVQLSPKEKKQKERVVVSKDKTSVGRIKTKKGAKTGDIYKQKSVSKTPKTQRVASASKKQEIIKKKEQSGYGIKSGDGSITGGGEKKTNKKK